MFSAVILCFLYIFAHTHIVCAEKIEEAKADEAILGLDAHNRDEAMSDDVAHESKEELDEKAGLDAHNQNEAISADTHEDQEESDENTKGIYHSYGECRRKCWNCCWQHARHGGSSVWSCELCIR